MLEHRGEPVSSTVQGTPIFISGRAVGRAHCAPLGVMRILIMIREIGNPQYTGAPSPSCC